jgi:beta-lactamase class D
MKRSIVLLFLSLSSCAVVTADFSQYYGDYAGKSCMVVYDESRRREILFHPDICEKASLPASTFKIFNSLVSLETGAVSNVDETIRWYGTNYPYPDWNRDQTMRTAFKYSVVWFYQECARRVGAEKMSAWLREARYGNGDISAGIDCSGSRANSRSRRWRGRFPEAALFEKLPFLQATMKAVKDIMLYETGEGYNIYAKTGTVSRDMPNYGWWVGFVEKGTNVYFFASRIETDAPGENFVKEKIEMPRSVLTALGIIP